MKFVELNSISRVIVNRPIPRVEEGGAFSYIKFGDIPDSGFLLHTKETKIVSEELGNNLFLQPYDILVPIQHRIDRIALIGKVETKILLSPPFAIVRIDESEVSIEQGAIALYMYLKSEKGQKGLSKLLDQSMRLPRIRMSDLRSLLVPLLSEEERIKQIEKFYQENKLYKEIDEIKNKISILHMT